MIKHGISLPPFGRLSEPRVLVEVAQAAEEQGWDGVFLWDHVLRPPEEPAGVADPWIMLTAIASVTTRIRVGPLITPVARRRPLKLAREVATLDLVADGRVTLGLGLGVDAGGEISKTGEAVDAKVRAAKLDEGVAVLDLLLRGENVVHHGTHYTLDDVILTPTGAQQPRVPFWLAARGSALAPVRRAAKYDGLALLAVSPGRFDEVVECVHDVRGSVDGFDFVVWTNPEHPLDEFEKRGATWAIHEMRPYNSLDEVMTTIATELG